MLMLRTARSSRLAPGAVLAAALLLGGCAHHRDKAPKMADMAPAKITQIGINAYLWRAALDTVSFMPLASVDSNGGVIVSDWYVNPSVPTERMRVTVTILDQDLRADAVRVAASRQVNQGAGWVDAPVAAQTVQRLEDIIIEHARDLRRGAITG
jgi:hypothetical protein